MVQYSSNVSILVLMKLYFNVIPILEHLLFQLGRIAGAIIGGFVIRRINPWILVAVTVGLSGIFEIFVPLCTDLVSFGIILTLNSCTGMLYDSSKYCCWFQTPQEISGQETDIMIVQSQFFLKIKMTMKLIVS